MRLAEVPWGRRFRLPTLFWGSFPSSGKHPVVNLPHKVQMLRRFGKNTVSQMAPASKCELPSIDPLLCSLVLSHLPALGDIFYILYVEVRICLFVGRKGAFGYPWQTANPAPI